MLAMTSVVDVHRNNRVGEARGTAVEKIEGLTAAVEKRPARSTPPGTDHNQLEDTDVLHLCFSHNGCVVWCNSFA